MESIDVVTGKIERRAAGRHWWTIALLDFAGLNVDNESMVISGHVQNGVVVLDGGLALPEGAVVVVSYPGPVAANTADKSERIEVPLVSTGEPGTVSLTGEQIADILDREDVSSRR
jgi:hypothetical protein